MLCRVYLCLFLGLALLATQSLADEPREPTPQELLAGMGYDASPEGLAEALESGDPWAQIYSLMILQETNDRTFLETAKSLLESNYIKVQLEAAKLLSQSDRVEGIEWLRKWENIDLNFSSPLIDTVDAVLDAASALARKGDERLRKHVGILLRHKFWTIRIHAARALGDFTDTDNPEMEAIWLTSADVAVEALEDSTVREDFVELYLVWLVDSLFRQTKVTPAMIEKFVELAKVDHPVICRTIGARLSEFDDAGDGDRNRH